MSACHNPNTPPAATPLVTGRTMRLPGLSYTIAQNKDTGLTHEIPATRRPRDLVQAVLVCTPVLRHAGACGALKSSLVGGVRERRGRLAADDRRGLVDELVILE